MMHGFYSFSGQLVIKKLVSVLSFPIFGVYVVIIVFGECVIVFQSKPCVTNPVSILYISPIRIKSRTSCRDYIRISYPNSLLRG